MICGILLWFTGNLKKCIFNITGNLICIYRRDNRWCPDASKVQPVTALIVKLGAAGRMGEFHAKLAPRDRLLSSRCSQRPGCLQWWIPLKWHKASHEKFGFWLQNLNPSGKFCWHFKRTFCLFMVLWVYIVWKKITMLWKVDTKYFCAAI